MKDNINPEHYKTGKIECIEAIASALSKEEYIGYLRGNLIKYTWRVRMKGGAEDIEKGIWYAARLVDILKEGNNVEN